MWHWRCFGGRCCLAICSGRNMYKTCSDQSLACIRRPFDALPMRRASCLNIRDGGHAFRCRLKERAAHAFSGVSSRAARRVADASSVVSGRNLRPHWSLRVVWGECPTQQQDPLPAHEAENNSAIVTERGGSTRARGAREWRGLRRRSSTPSTCRCPPPQRQSPLGLQFLSLTRSRPSRERACRCVTSVQLVVAR